MKTNKNLLGTLFLVIGTVACTFGAHAANSADRDYNVLVNTKGVKGETTPQYTLYTAYYCTKAQAGTFFGGADTYQTVTTFLTANMANYKSGMAALKKDGDELGTKSFDVDEYSFSTSVGSAPAAGDYFAIVAYVSAADEAENWVRVFSSSPSASIGGGILFEPGATGGGEAGDWTLVNVPEPTSGLLLLLGSALLALKRPASRKRYAATSKLA